MTGPDCPPAGAEGRDGRQPVRASVIIVDYNAGGALLRCLESVLATTGPGIEVIVVDNASTDGSAESAGARFPDLVLVRAGTNLGFGAGNNLGARRARGANLVFLNPDTVVESGWLDALLDPLETQPDAGLVTARILLAADPARINACGNTVHVTGLALCRGLGLPAGAFPEPSEVDAVSGAAFSIRRDLFETLGGFDEDMFLYVEDTDLSWRARLAGWRCLYAPGAVVRHEYSLRVTPLKVFYQERNRCLMLLKNFRWATLVALAPALVLAEIVTWGFVLLRDRANIGNKVRAYGWIARNLPAIVRKRRAVQALRRAPDREILRHTGFALDFAQVSGGALGKTASAVFNPLFRILRGLAMALVWW
jgi:GT2 family glycosyltransferase